MDEETGSQPQANFGARAFRLIVEAGDEGAWNLAVDESILAGYENHESDSPTLRLYSWVPPALSLGRGQLAAVSHAPDVLAAEGIQLVRRPTGGTAVLHDRERTYSVAARLRVDPFPGGVTDTYRKIAGAVELALRSLGLDARAVKGVRRSTRPRAASPLCFAERSQEEITVGGRKLVGAAQLRRRGAFLQHGSILLRADPVRTARAVGSPWPSEDLSAGIEDLLGRSLSDSELDGALIAAFSQVFGAQMVSAPLTETERARALLLRASKYRNDAWTLGGTIDTP